MGIFDFLRTLIQRPKSSDRECVSGQQEGAKVCYQIPSRSERGTVTYRQDLGTIESAGVGLQASIVVRTFTEQEIRENAQDNQWYFEPAFWKVTGEVEANHVALEALLPDLLIAHTSGSPKREQETVMKHLPEGTWRWVSYENHLLERDKESYEEEVEEINSSSLQDLLNGLKVIELRALYKKHSVEKSGSAGSKKAEIINAICSVVESDVAEEITGLLRKRFISELRVPGTVNYREMCNMFACRVAMMAYAFRRRKQMLEISDRYPSWKFIADDNPDVPKRCKKLDGKAFRFDDPFWDTGYPPCSRLDCNCSVEVKMK